MYSRTKKLKQKIIRRIFDAKEGGLEAEVKVALHDIPTGNNLSINGNSIGWAASIIKVPIMISILNAIEEGKINFETKLRATREFQLEPFDYTSRLPEGTSVSVSDLLYHMIVESDNEATNILANRIGIESINRNMRSMGMKRTMLGHLLCPNVPRYRSRINPDGSNITCANDMGKLFRQIYDPKNSKLSYFVRTYADKVMRHTRAAYIKDELDDSIVKAKIGLISDPLDGSDNHEVGIIDDRLIVCLMANKIRPFKNIQTKKYENPLDHLSENNYLTFKDWSSRKLKESSIKPISILEIYSGIVGDIALFYKEIKKNS